MKLYNFFLWSFILLLTSQAVSAEDNATSKRFYAGTVLRAEVQPDNPDMPIVIKNISEFEPESRITADVGYAIVTVNLDPGRSLGIYDYSLVDKQKKEFPCVAVADRENDFDRSEWEFSKTKPNNKYSMLFKVQLPPTGKPQYSLHFNLIKDNVDDIPLPFINIGDKSFTKYKDIPPEGILGIDPNKPQPIPGPEPETKKPDAVTDTVKPAEEKKPEPEKPGSKSEAKRKADQEAWEKMMGTTKLEFAEPEKEEPKKKEPKKKEAKKEEPKKKDAKKEEPKKKDAWDDWN